MDFANFLRIFLQICKFCCIFVPECLTYGNTALLYGTFITVFSHHAVGIVLVLHAGVRADDYHSFLHLAS